MVHIDQERRAHYEGVWNKNKGYNPYSIVIHNGDYYLSVSAVDVGIEISNDSYWMWYSTAKEDSTLELRMEKAESDIIALGSAMRVMGEDITGLNLRVQNNIDDIKILSSTLNQVGNRLDSAENDIIILSSAVRIAGSDIADLKSRVSTNEENITILSSAMNQVGIDMSNVNSDAINFTKLLIGL